MRKENIMEKEKKKQKLLEKKTIISGGRYKESKWNWNC